MNQLCKLGIKKIIFLIKTKQISNYELTKICLNNLLKTNKKNNFLIEIFYKNAIKYSKKMDRLNKISIPISIKNIFSIKNKKLTCNSNILKKFKSKYDSSISKLLKKNNFNILSIDKLDEFCLGGSGLNNCNLYNLYNKNFVVGGSSAGSALNISYGCNLFSIGSDTGGSIRTPSSYCGVVGYKPTNGLLSRYGMVPYSSYLDNCSIITNSVENCKYLFNILNYKNKDLFSNKKYIFYNIKKKKIISIINYYDFFVDLEIKILFEKIIRNFEKLGFLIDMTEINFHSLNELYENISSKEFYSNSSKFDGIKYGFQKKFFKDISDYIKLNRIFSNNCKNKILKGQAEFRISKFNNFNNYFDIFLKKIFKNSQFIIIPTNICFLKIIENNFSEYLDLFTLISNIYGYPTINMNMGFINHKPIGFSILSEKNYDTELLNLSILYESSYFKNYVYN
ncbi:amidase family protein [Candidatus Carsonella ruddii]|uniref:amidase family protein n=1 Tax=Carsonella ruddii TaxID=114186 RepID=UPI00035BFBF5|nr:amidase family protein [Candidatus Carsonella ruddii]AGS06542.1 aspartyl/glutamyl-tRNA amidotransferase subunit A [Candidatus Carsonella ruddii DC]ALA96800.1 hypothetical protein AMC76_00285 [Candidatus Carsonella ruddii]